MCSPLTFLARSIARAKWSPKPFLLAGALPADVGSCLRTTACCLSVWRCTGETDSIDDVALALALSANKNRFDKMHILLVPEQQLLVEGCTIVNSRGATRVEDMESRHADIVDLSLWDISNIAQVMSWHVEGEYCVLFSVGKIKKLVSKAIADNRVDLESLPPEMKDALKKTS